VSQQDTAITPAKKKGFFAKHQSKVTASRARATDPHGAGWTSIAHFSGDKRGLWKHGAWTLWHRHDADGWHNFVVRHNDTHFRKFSYWGAWNGERFASSKDLAILQEKRPKVYAWLEAVCRNTWPR
jgi:hypothetical protein